LLRNLEEKMNRNKFVRRAIKTAVIIEILYLVAHTPVAIAQEPTVAATVKPSQITHAWESARDGALIGLGSGAAISLLSYSVNAQSVDYGRIMAGTTGAGFLFGALYGFVENRYFSDNNENSHTSLRPQLFHSSGDKVGYGMFASLNF
jgi:hypothetical protein